MKLSEAIAGPGDVAVRQSTGAVAIWIFENSLGVLKRRGFSVDWYQGPNTICGDDWVRVWPETERIIQLREHVWRNARLVSDCLDQVPGGLTNSMPIEKVPDEIANRTQKLKTRIAELERRIHELENPTLGEPLPVGYVIPANVPHFVQCPDGIQLRCFSHKWEVEENTRRWLDPRPLPKLPPEQRYTVVSKGGYWDIHRDGEYIIGDCLTKADAERIARLLNESEASDE